MPPRAATEPKPLTTAELRVLSDLIARHTLFAGADAPEIIIGEPYVALVNLSVPRRSNQLADPKDRQVDLVRRGEIVHLTDAEARCFLRCNPDRDGRQIPVIQKLHGPESQAEQRFVLPRLLTGRQFGPPANARPDPRGSSYVQEVTIPEQVPAQPGSETRQATEVVDAQDIPPRGAPALLDGVDRDLVDDVKQHMLAKEP